MATLEVDVGSHDADLVPDTEENWDDDFEFGAGSGSGSGRANPRTPPRNRKQGERGYTQMSIGSRAETEDWDAEELSPVKQTEPERDLRTPTKPPSSVTASPLPLAVAANIEQETENWDDDFEYSRNSPMKPGASTNRLADSSSTPAARAYRPQPSSPLSPASPSRSPSTPASPMNKNFSSHKKEDRADVDTWDDDLDRELDADFALKNPHMNDEEDRTVTTRTRRAALARAAAQHPPPLPAPPPPPTPALPPTFASNNASSTVFLAPHSTAEPTSVVEPFPSPPLSSPASSVFSVPGTVRTIHSASTAPLMSPSTGGQFGYPSASARVFSLLPPSPQVHRERERKERERRRLRKRSRPGDRERMREREGVFELVDVAHGADSPGSPSRGGRGYGRRSLGANHDDHRTHARRSFDSARAFSEEEDIGEGLEDGNADGDIDEMDNDAEGAQSTSGHSSDAPRPRPVIGPPRTSSAHPASQHVPGGAGSVPATPGKQTLLGRIGSVKRWVGIGSGSGAGPTSGSAVSGGIVGKLQRRRGMSTGADGGYGYGDARLTTPDHQRTPRPQSSLSSFGNYNNYTTHTHPYSARAPSKDPPTTANATAGSSSWFFRASSRASSNTNTNNASPSPSGGPAKRGFRTPSTPGSPAGRTRPGSTPNNASPSPGASPASPDGGARKQGKLTRARSGARSRSGSRSRSQAGGRTPRRSVGSTAGVDGRAEASSAVDSVRGRGGGDGTDGSHGPPPLARRPSAGRRVYPYRPSSRGGVRASMDFSASRASLGMSMSILEAEERAAAGAEQTPSYTHTGRGRGYSVGSGTPGASGGRGTGTGTDMPPPSPTAARLGKRKSLGFMQLRRAMGGGVPAEDSVDSGMEKPGGARYGGLGIGRALGLKAGTDHSKEDTVDYERPRRKSLSRLLRRDDSAARLGGTPKTPIKESFNTAKLPPEKEPEKVQEGARGFMGSVRRISLVGRHKRTKSGGVLIDRSVPVPPTPPSPSASSGFFSSARRSSGTVGDNAHTGTASGAGKHTSPYALPPLPTSESQISLSLRQATASAGHLPIPASMLTAKKSGSGRRIVSTASSRSQGSSVLPPSTSSASSDGRRSVASSRNPSGTVALAREEETDNDKDVDNDNLHKTPRQPHRPAPIVRRPSSSSRSRRSRASEERPALANVGRASMDFEAKMRQSLDQDGALGSVPPLPSSSPTSLSLLPPIELQPPSPPQTLGPAGTGTKARTAITEIDQKDAGALNLPLPSSVSLSPTASSSSLFYTPKSSPRATLGMDGSPASVNASVRNKLSPGQSPGTQHSASLGRVGAATAAAATGEEGSSKVEDGEGKTGDLGKAKVPRRNSLGDLKIPARISQAQVNIKRDLGMVREFASSVEQLKEMQKTYHILIGQVQQIFESHIHAYSARPSTSVTPSDIPTAEVVPPPRTTSAATAGGFFANLKPKTRARSNTNPNPAPPSSSIASPTSLTTASASSSASPSVPASASASTQDVTTAQVAYKEMAALFWTINAKYRIPWECADLLIELGGGGGGDEGTASQGPSTSVSVPFVQQAQAAVFDIPGTSVGKKTGRERAITLAGNQTTPIKNSYAVQPELSANGAAGIANNDNAVVQPVIGPPPASPPASNNMSWRSSTGRHDFSQRQLVLLREMLNNSNAAAAATASVPSGQVESGLRSASAPSASAGSDMPPQVRDASLQAPYVDRDWRWGDARNSTITLPSEESIQHKRQQIQREYVQDRQRDQSHPHQHAIDPERKKRRGIGMAGIRDMLRALKRGATEGTASSLSGEGGTGMRAAALSTASLSTQSSKGSKRHRYPHPRVPPIAGDSGRRRAKTNATADSSGTGTVRASRDIDAAAARSPLSTFVPPRASPRRPSLASIFRIGNSNKQRVPSMSTDDLSGSSAVQDQLRPRTQGQGQSSSGADGEGGSTSEEDWDRMDSASDLDGLGRSDAGDNLATVRGGSNSLRKSRQRTSPYLQDSSFDPPVHQQTLPLPLTLPTTSAHPHAIISKRSFNVSSASLRPLPDGAILASPPSTGQRLVRLSNVAEAVDEANSPTKSRHDPGLSTQEDAHDHRLPANVGSPASVRSHAPTLAGSVLSVPPSQFTSSASVPLLKEGKLAMTPENIKPLLENAKEVLAKLQECIVEMQTLMAQSSTGA